MTDDESDLQLLAGAYFNQDWRRDAPDEDSIVRQFVRDEGPESAAHVAAEIEAALAGSPSEEQLAEVWRRAYFTPTRFGMTYRQWFERMLVLLRA